MATRTRRPVAKAQVISVQCPCGGKCANEQDSTAIEYMDKIVWCQVCNEQYELPASYFKPVFVSLVQDEREDDLYTIMNQWDRSPEGHGTPEEATMAYAWRLYSWHGCAVSGVLATMKEDAAKIEASNPTLADAYRRFVAAVEE